MADRFDADFSEASPTYDIAYERAQVVNPYYSQSLDAQSGFASDLVGGAIASVVDFGTSLFNSVTFDQFDVSTADILSRLNNDALRVYEENTDTINTLSFIGGVIAPSGLAMKGVQALKNGTKAFSIFSKERRAADLTRLEELAMQGPQATRAYRDLRNAVYMRGAAENVVDAAAMEVAVLSTMNAHPFMEDYLEDPIKNFGISLALGGVIGGGIGHIADRHAVSMIEGTAQAKAASTALQGYTGVNAGMSMVDQMQIRQANIEQLNALLKNTEDPLDGLTKEYAERWLLRERAEQETAYKAFADKLEGDATGEVKNALRERFFNDTRFQSIDSIKLAKIKENSKLTTPGAVQQDSTFGKLYETVKNKVTGAEERRARTRVFLPEADSFISAPDLAHVGRANALKGVNAETVKNHSSISATKILAADQDAGLLINNLPSPQVDKMFAEALTYTDSVDLAKFKRAALGQDDLPMKQAALMRMRKEINAGRMDPADTIVLTSKEPIYSDEIVEKVMRKSGVQPDYTQRSMKLAYGDGAFNNDPRGARLSTGAHDMLTRWTAGSGMSTMRQAADAYLYKGYGRIGVPDANIKAFAEIYEHPRSVAFRNAMKELADGEGYVYLWRGMSTGAKGHAGLASYTVNKQQAVAGFAKGGGSARLYRIHTDDIITNIIDDAGRGYSKMNNTGGEIIVRAPSHPTEPTLPIGNTEQPLSRVVQQSSSVRRVTAADLAQDIINQKEQLLGQHMSAGMDPLEIAIRTNTPVDTVKAYMASGGMEQVASTGMPFIEYANIAAIDSKLSAATQPIALSANIRKESWGKWQAGMDVSTQNKMNNEIVGTFMLQSNSPIAQQLYQRLFSPQSRKMLDIVRAQIVQANNGNAGTRFLQSADSFAEHMGDLGRFASYFGQELEGISNSTIRRYFDSQRGNMEAIANNVAKRSELDLARQVNASLSGWRTFRDGKFWQMAEVYDSVLDKMVKREQPVLFQGKPFVVTQPEVREFLEAMGRNGREQYITKNLQRKILGQQPLSDIGYWLPSMNPRNKFIGYLHNVDQGTTQLIVGNTQEELKQSMELLKAANKPGVDSGNILIFDKSSQAEMSLVRGREDTLFMSVANESMLHGGSSAQAFIKTNADPLAELIGGMEHSVISATTALAETALWDISDNLKRLSAINRAGTAAQPLSRIKAAIHRPKDAAKEIRDTMFNLRSLPDYTTWHDINQGFEGAVGYTMRKLTDAWKALRPEQAKGLDYEGYKAALKKAGVYNQFEAFGEEAAAIYKQSLDIDIGNQASRMVTLANGYAATAALRFGDLAQPLVNAMSLPILMTAGILDKMPPSFMGAAKKAEVKGMLNVAQIMHDGVRAMNSPVHAKLDKLWKERGYFDAIVSEATEVLALPRDLTPGLMTTLEKGLESRLVKNFAAKPADWTETMARRTALHTGAVLAKRIYPGLSDAGVTLFAKNFMDRSIGNYHAAQRPVFFQGTMGVAMGLFQTYMLTFMQAMYKQLQLKNYKALGTTMLMQAGVFGAASLPGFNQVSQMIGEHYSDSHVDLKTGTIRALDDSVAKMVLFGLPSSLGPAVYSRGDLAPRISTPANLEALPQVQMLTQSLGTLGNVIGALGADGEDIPRSLLQALSLQSVNRPLARVSELATGYSTTTQGTTVSTPEEVWTPMGVIARMLGSRPTEEALAREVHHLNRMYESLDRENRQKVVNKLRTAIRADSLDADKIDQLALDYMDEGGTPTGWRSAYRTAIMTTELPLTETVKDKLKETSALNVMIDMIDEQ